MKGLIRKAIGILATIAGILIIFSAVEAKGLNAAQDFQYPTTNEGLKADWNYYTPTDSLGFGKWNELFHSYHLGQDTSIYLTLTNTKFYAVADGIVRISDNKNWSGYGNYDTKTKQQGRGYAVVIEHKLPDGTYVTSLYGHIQSGSDLYSEINETGLIPVGSTVVKGQYLGKVADYMIDTGANWHHLHFGIRKGQYTKGHDADYIVGYSNTGWTKNYTIHVTWYNPTKFIDEHLLPPIPPKQKLTVLSPNGNENWPAGSEQKIQWKYTGKQTTSVKIELQKGSSPLFTELIAVFVPTDYNGDGSYLWTIPATHETGTDYKVVVTSMENSKRTDTSDGYFTISAPTPTPIGGPVHNINKNTDYTTIQAAINDANIGDEIDVDSGTYYENVNVNKQLILNGIDTGGGKPVVDANGSGSAITLNAGWSTLRGFIVTRSSSWPMAGIRITSNKNIIIDNVANNNDWSGINLGYSSDNIITGNVANNNGYLGISLYRSYSNTIKDNTANNNNWGITIHDGSSDNTIQGNNVEDNKGAGIIVEFASSNDPSSYPSNNKIFQNNLVNNSIINAYDHTGTNQWDNGTVGNYYSDYTGIDLNSDGISDTPYPISGGNSIDRYPLMAKWQN